MINEREVRTEMGWRGQGGQGDLKAISRGMLRLLGLPGPLTGEAVIRILGWLILSP